MSERQRQLSERGELLDACVIVHDARELSRSLAAAGAARHADGRRPRERRLENVLAQRGIDCNDW